jgi:DNA-binding GntR family transcriptional regulator
VNVAIKTDKLVQSEGAPSAKRIRRFQTGAERIRAGNPTATDEVVMKLRQWLATGRIVPGQRMTEADLARELGVSKGPVREAMQRLVADGVIVTAPYKGYLVHRLTREEVIGVFDVMELLDGLMARRAAEGVAAGRSTEGLKKAMASFENAHFEVGRSMVQGDETVLAQALVSLSGNNFISQISDRIQYSVFPLQFRALQTRGIPANLLNLVRKFVASIMAGDAKAAEAGAKIHARALSDHIQSLSDEWFEPQASE